MILPSIPDGQSTNLSNLFSFPSSTLDLPPPDMSNYASDPYMNYYYIYMYKNLHMNPELSAQERETSALVVRELQRLGSYTVRSNIGGYGVVGVLANGSGPTVMLRADMDGLPVKEETGLPYASTKMMTDASGNVVPVMHACGHDVHVTCLLAAAKALLDTRRTWSGTLIVLFQPAEEFINGAQRMVDDGLYTRHNVPIPDIVLGQHVLPFRQGSVGAHEGTFLSESSSYDIRIFGKGGHATEPHRCIDPVLAASHTVVRLNNVVSREVKPGEVAILSVCSIKAGDAANIIPNYADLKLTTRSYTSDVHEKLDASLRRVVTAECEAANCEQAPEIKKISHTPATVNQPELAQKVNEAFAKAFKGSKDAKVIAMPTLGGSEDFSILANAVKKPYIFWGLGGIDGDTWDKLEKEGKLDTIPTNHSSKFAPTIDPTLKVGCQALCVGALAWLGPAKSSLFADPNSSSINYHSLFPRGKLP